jgi:hypothetical protein
VRHHGWGTIARLELVADRIAALLTEANWTCALAARGTGSGFVARSRQVVQVGQSIVEPHLDGRLAVVADGEPGPVAGYVHRRMLGRVGEGELHRARNRALGAKRCTGWAANLECHSFNPPDLP